MTLKNDEAIKQFGRSTIAPFNSEQVSRHRKRGGNWYNVISYGLSSAGYDIRAADEFKLFNPNYGGLFARFMRMAQILLGFQPTYKKPIDPKNFDEAALLDLPIQEDATGRYIVQPPHSFVLARSLEWFKMPRDCVGLMTVKSTYARCGQMQPPTVLEPEWCGHITIELSNNTPLPAKIYAGEGIAQVLFFDIWQPDVSYKDRNGKYQGQQGITPAKGGK